MTVGSLPFLILNYGAEMIFILHTRLVAQNVNAEASRIVMNDVVRHMFSSEFIDELLRPQRLYSIEETKEVLTSLTQTSVMRLSSVSMKKLFDLMTMGVKYQLFTLRHPLELLELTWTHLEEVQRIIPPGCQTCINPVFVHLKQLCSKLSIGDLAEIRKELLNFFAGRSVAVSVLLDDGLQTSSGAFYLPEDRFLPPLAACEPPGSIRYYNSDGTLIGSEVFTPHRDAALRYPVTIPPGVWNPMNPATRLTRKGMNMYSAHRKTAEDPSGSQTHTSSAQTEMVNAVTGELNYWSQLLRGNQNNTQGTFKWSLFNDDDEEEGGYEDDNTAGNDTVNKNNISHNGTTLKGDSLHTPVVSSDRIKKGEAKRDNNDLMRIVAGFRIDKTVTKPTGAISDLLDIMDED
ncbi:Organic solute carrier protein 1 [Trypanosoma melophagium]|uniref:Organic solute carrier protein 1 n=1 Tax=Trypanosoma melophagium TaxID=715481 RepID=UPI003519DFB1|nr:Organic solute carrier protein 1 [Trypanosoma melophagium]